MIIRLILIMLIVTACSKTYIRRHYTSKCSVIQLENGAEIVCQDGTKALILEGEDGNPGQSAKGCSVEPFSGGATITCDDGTIDILDGESVTGPVGPAGTSCTVSAAAGGAVISCEDGTSQFISDGLAGQDGTDGIVELIDPCGDNPNQFDEVLLRTTSGQILTYFESGNRRFLAVLVPGNYVTTDSQACHFSVTEDSEGNLNVTW